jgi:hypothetical protein
MAEQPKVEAAVRARYPNATVTGSGPYGVALHGGRTEVCLFTDRLAAHRFACGLPVQYFGPPIRTLMRPAGEGQDE